MDKEELSENAELTKAHNRHVDLVARATSAVELRTWGENLRHFAMQEDPEKVLFFDRLELPNYDGRTVIVAGSGISLDRDLGGSASALLDKSTLIAGATTTPYLLAKHRRAPDILFISDSNPVLRDYLTGWEEELTETLVVLPVTAPRIWRDYPVGKRYYYYVPLFQTEGSVPDNPINRLMLGMTSPRGTLRPYIVQAGSVSGSIMGFLYDAWIRTPIEQVILTGVDCCVGKGVLELRVPLCSPDGQHHYPGAGLPPRLEVEEWPIELRERPRYVTYVDLLYATNILMLVRDAPFRTTCLSEWPILAPYIGTRSPHAVLTDAPGPFSPLTIDMPIRQDNFWSFIRVINPILDKLQERMVSKAKLNAE